ncbi:MAG: substrate-binding domain-containing protein, partial [Anaerolineae bacterium]|nr:substrate-binding domain-containing protein [Anaerolineae bacterium]
AGYVGDETRIRVEQAIAELQYIPNTLSQSLRFKKTNTIALIVSDITNPFWTTVTRGVEDATSEHGLSVILCNTDEKQDKLENYVNLLLQRQTDGFLLVPINSNPGVVERIKTRNVPVVVLDRSMPDVEVDVVRSDSEGGSYELVNYLISLGHRRIAMLSGPPVIATSRQRVIGYQHALQANGMPLDENLMLYGEFKQEAGYRMLKQVIQTAPPPTAIYAGNNLIALGALKALYEMGLRIPEDISVVTFDDLPFFLPPNPFLTLAAQSPYELGKQAAQKLITRLAGQGSSEYQEIVLPVEIIIRQSTRSL